MLKPIVWCLNAFQTTERTMALLSNPMVWWWNSKIRWWDISISPNSVSTLRGSYGRCKGRCTIRVLQLVHGILPVNSRMKCFLCNVQAHFDRAGSHKVWVEILVRRILLLNSRIKCFVQCPNAFSLRRLAQSVGRDLGLRHVNYRTKWLAVQRPCAFRLRRLTQSVGRRLGLRHFTCKLSHIVALVKCPHAFRLRRRTQSMGPGLGVGPPPQHHHSQHHHLPPLDLNIINLHVIFRNINIIILFIILLNIIILNINIIIIIIITTTITIIIIIINIIIHIILHHPPTPPPLFGVSCRDNFLVFMGPFQGLQERIRKRHLRVSLLMPRRKELERLVRTRGTEQIAWCPRRFLGLWIISGWWV